MPGGEILRPYFFVLYINGIICRRGGPDIPIAIGREVDPPDNMFWCRARQG